MISAPPVRSGCALSVVVPAFNEEARLGPSLGRMIRFLEGKDFGWEIIVVDDGSIDKTSERARSVAAGESRVRVLSFERNHGKGFAVKQGVLSAAGSAILFSDADLSTPIEELDRLYRRLREGWEVVIASRRLRESRIFVRQPVHRRHMGRVFNGLVSLLGVRGFADTQCGFKLFARRAARYVFSRLKTTGFAFDVEALMLARRGGFRVAEVPVCWTDSPVSRVNPLTDSARMFLELLRMRGLL